MTIHQSQNFTYLFEKDHVNSWAFKTQVFTKDECQQIINYGNSLNKNTATVDINKVINNNIRISNVSWINPTNEIIGVYEKLTDAIQELNQKFFKFDLIGFGEGLQFTEYKAPSGHYIKHTDSMFNATIRKLSDRKSTRLNSSHT